jgi:hypothetical protein
VVVVIHAENLPEVTRHCGLPCLKIKEDTATTR